MWRRRWWKGVCIFLAFASLIMITQAINITEISTPSPSIIKIKIANATTSGYIFIGTSPQTFSYAYSHQGNGTYTITTLFIKQNTTYYVKACDNTNCTSVLNFTSEKGVNLEKKNFTSQYDELMEGGDILNISKLSSTIPSIYTTLLTDIFWAMFFGGIFLAYWIRQEDVMLPSIVGMICSGALIVMLPPSAQHIAYTLLVVSIAGMLYTVIKARR